MIPASLLIMLLKSAHYVVGTEVNYHGISKHGDRFGEDVRHDTDPRSRHLPLPLGAVRIGLEVGTQPLNVGTNGWHPSWLRSAPLLDAKRMGASGAEWQAWPPSRGLG